MGNPEVYKGEAIKETKEAKEKAIGDFTKLCIEYHKKTKWGLEDFQKDKSLLSKFEKIRGRVFLLPESLKSVFWHRYAYLKAMVDLGKNKRIRDFVLYSQRRFGYSKIRYTNAELKEIQKERVFKDLAKSDFDKAVKILGTSLSYLSWVNTSGGLASEAKKYLKGDRVDDFYASERLRKSFASLVVNIPRLEQLHA